MVTRNKFFKYKIPVMALILLLACMAIPWPAVAASAPVVSGISPNSGSSDGGTSVAITGTGFGTGSDVATAVYFGSTPAVDFAVYSNTSITAVSPAAQAGDVTVDVTVYGPGGTSATSSSDQFTYIPAVSGISPNSGSSDGGTSVIISGNCFGTGSDVATAVYFGSTAAASFTVNSDTQITAVSPDVNSLDLPESTPVDITVYGPGGTSATSSSDQFTYIPAGFMGMNKLSSPLTTALQGTDTGNLIFTMGNSVYNPTGEIAPGGTATVDYTVSGIPAGATVTAARLYAYCAFSSNASYTQGEPISVSMTLNAKSLNELNSYSDTEGMGSYNFPCGSISFDATSAVSGNGSYTAVLTNTSPLGTIGSFYGIGLLIIYHDPNGKPFEYWVNEGCDLIWPDPYYTPAITPVEATTTTSFTGGSAIDTTDVTAADLTTVVPSGWYGQNSLTFNGTQWTGVYTSDQTHQLAVDSNRDVTSLLKSSGNGLSIQSTGDYMFPTNAILVVYTTTPTVGGGGGGGSTVSYTPSLQTEAATSVTATSAVLNGDITSDNGYAVTDYGFLWGTSSSSLTNKLDVGTSNISGAFTDTLSSLTAGTTYYFEAYATNSQGTADGAVMSLTAGVQTPTTPTTPTSSVFSDVPASYWGYNAITSLSTQGIVAGYPDGTFKPNADITRAEFAAMLVKALRLNTGGTTGTFTDVTADAWCYGPVNTAAAAGLVSGLGNNQFGPYTLITREQMAVMVAKALGTKTPATNGTELNAFSDSSTVSSWAVTGMEEAVKAGIVSGMTADTLAPMANATRAQAAAMIYHLLVFLGK